MKIRAILINEANELYDMGIIGLKKLIEWPFYAITTKDRLTLNQAQARIKERGKEDVNSTKSRADLINALTHSACIQQGLFIS